MLGQSSILLPLQPTAPLRYAFDVGILIFFLLLFAYIRATPSVQPIVRQPLADVLLRFPL